MSFKFNSASTLLLLSQKGWEALPLLTPVEKNIRLDKEILCEAAAPVKIKGKNG